MVPGLEREEEVGVEDIKGRTLLCVTLHCQAEVLCFCQSKHAQKLELKHGLRSADQH